MRHIERLEVFVSSALARIHQVCDTLLLKFFLVNTAVLSQKLFDCAVAATDPDHDRLALNLHEDLLPCEAIDAWCLPLKMHLTAKAKRRFVDVVSEVTINVVILHRLVDEELVLDRCLNVLYISL